jgi:hypothetical protein
MAKSPEVHGVPLEAFQEPIDTAYGNYQELAGNNNVDISFQRLAAGRLELTPDKPNTARSVTVMRHDDQVIGEVYTILMAPYDGTGDENVFRLGQNIQVADGSRVHKWYPGDYPAIVPRPKGRAHTELWLPLTAIDPYAGGSQALHAGKLDVLGTDSIKVAPWELTVLGELGLSGQDFSDALNGFTEVPPRAQLTTGYKDGRRFGDPHAIYNATSALQVCGFVALSHEVMAHRHAEVVDALGAVPFGSPRPLPQAMQPVVNQL